MLNYNNYLYETILSISKKNLNLELNNKGKQLLPFIYYNTLNKYLILKSINFEQYNPINNRVTLLKGITYLDTEINNKQNKKLLNVEFNNNDYFFYKLVSSEYREREISSSVSIPYDENRFNDQYTENNKLHFIVIKKNTNVITVRINNSLRTSFGFRAEKTISIKFNWRLVNTKIKLNLIKKEENNIEKIFLTDLLKTDITTLNTYQDLFKIDNMDNVNKYDLIITEGEYIGQKIEVKGYNVKDLFYKNGQSKQILLAEQLKISTKQGLKKIVTLYHEMNPNIDIGPLLNDYSIDMGEKLSWYFNVNNNQHEYIDLINDIRDFYNQRINFIFNKFRDINTNIIMSDIFGIYFFNNKSGVDGFLIKNIDNNIKNINYTWVNIKSHWGLNRIKLMFSINPNAYRYVWIGNLHTLAKTFKVNNLELNNKLKIDNIKTNHQPIIKNTNIGNIKWNSKKGYWEKINIEIDIDEY